MTVQPYVTVSLIAGLGRLTYQDARALGVKAGAVLLVLWAIALGTVFLFPLTFPELESASFFSRSEGRSKTTRPRTPTARLSTTRP